VIPALTFPEADMQGRHILVLVSDGIKLEPQIGQKIDNP